MKAIFKMIYKATDNYQNNLQMNLFGERNSFKYFGSCPSFCVYALATIWLICHLSYSWEEMFSEQRDNFYTTILPNDFSHVGHNPIRLNNYNFMPYFDIRFLQ